MGSGAVPAGILAIRALQRTEALARRYNHGYTRDMKTAISLPDHDFQRFEQAAADQRMSRSEFYRRAADHFVSSLGEGADLTRLADAALEDSGQPSDNSPFLAVNEQALEQGDGW